MFHRIEQVSQEESPSDNCTKNLLELFDKSARNKPPRSLLDDFTKELEQNLQCIDSKDVAALESHRETHSKPSRHRSSGNKTLMSELEESMMKDEQTRVFMEAMFPDFETTDRQIPLKEFLSVALTYFFPDEKLSRVELQLLRKRCKKLLTTTNENVLSLNALSVVTKTSSIRVLLLEQTVRVRQELEQEQKTQEQEKILSEMANIEKELQNERQHLNKRAKELKDRQQALSVREKALQNRERDLKAVMQREYEKLLERSQKAIQESLVEVDKKTNLIERNIKYKIQLLDKRIEDYQKVQLAERQIDTKMKEKCIRLEKELQITKVKSNEAERIAASFLEEKQSFVKKIVALEEKLTKANSKVSSLKEEIAVVNRRIQQASLRQGQLQKELLGLKEEKQKQQTVIKKPIDQESAVHLFACMIDAAQRTIPKIITFYREQPERELDFELAEVFYEKSLDVLSLYQDFFTETLSVKQSEALLNDHSPVVRFMVQLTLFTLNCNYAREKEQVIPRVEDTPTKSKKSTDQKHLFANDKLCGKIIKSLKKTIGKETSEHRLSIEYSLWSLLMAETDFNVQMSLACILKAVLSSSEAKSYLMQFECLTCLLLKSTSANNSEQSLSHMLDLLLEYCSSDSLNATLSKLEEFENYMLLLGLIPRLQHQGQLLERLSIILQRYSYVYKKDMVLSSQLVKTIQDIVRTHQSSKDSLIAANFSAVLDSSA